MYERHIAHIARAFAVNGVRIVAIERGEEILLPVCSLHQLHERVAQTGQGNAAQRVSHTLRELVRARRDDDYVPIRPDEAPKLTRLIEEWEQEATRAEKLRRGIIPGALNSREVTELYRRGWLGR